MRSGVIAQKVGMTRVFTDAGEHVPVTVLQARQLPGRRPPHQGEERLRRRCSSASGARKVKNTSEGASAAISPSPRSSPSASSPSSASTPRTLIPVGAEITADHFVAGQYVDVTGTSIGKGFAGGMKRRNFGGLRATHGVSVSHRSHGSTGQRQDPGKVFKDKKMAGHMGDERVTTQNVKVVPTDVERGLILVRARCPAPRAAGSWCATRSRRRCPKDVPKPGKFRLAETARARRAAEPPRPPAEQEGA